LQINKLYADGKTSAEIHALSQGPDYRARVFNRCFINSFFVPNSSHRKEFDYAK